MLEGMEVAAGLAKNADGNGLASGPLGGEVDSLKRNFSAQGAIGVMVVGQEERVSGK